MATNWNAVLANINNASDILAILRKVLGLLDGKVDLTRIDEIIADITNMQISVDTALNEVNSALSNFDTESQEAIENVIAAGLMEGFATEAELLATRPTVAKKYAKAEDTDVVWFWNKPEAAPAGDYWTSTGLSELDQAKLSITNALFKYFSYNSSFLLDEYTKTNLSSYGTGDLFALQLKQRDIVVSKIKLRTASTGSLTDFDIRLYIVDKSMKVLNVLSTHNLIVGTKNTYEVSGLNISIPNGQFLAIGIEPGVSLLHVLSGATQANGFFYAQNIATVLNLAVGYRPPSMQNLAGAIPGIGIEAVGSILPEKYSQLYNALLVNELVTYDYLAAIASNSQANGEFWTVTKIFPNAATIDTLTVNLKSLIDSNKTTFKVRPYFIDATTKRVLSAGSIIEFNIQSGVTKYTATLNLSVPPNAHFSLGVEPGVNIGYYSNAAVGTFGYSSNLATSLNFAVGNNAAPVQTISGATGFAFTVKTQQFFDHNNYVKKGELPPSLATNYLSGKKIIAIGDSKVKGHSLSDAANQTWLAKLANRNNMTRVNYGINGTYLSNKQYTSGGITYDGVVVRYTSMDNDADYILVFAGTNDANNSIVPMGTDDSTDDTTFKGALNVLCDGLLTKYPNKKIGFITPYFRNSNYPPYIDAIKTICKKYSIPVFDNSEKGGVCWTNAAQISAITLGDTYHLNESGMEFASYKYEAFIRSL